MVSLRVSYMYTVLCNVYLFDDVGSNFNFQIKPSRCRCSYNCNSMLE